MRPEPCRRLLHNMSAPPKSTITYQGLSDLAGEKGTDAPRRGLEHAKAADWVGLKIGLPEQFQTEPEDILRLLGIDPGADPAATLDNLIEQRARALPLPDGCLVLPLEMAERDLSPDPLTALAVVTKCSEYVWLRSKTPSLARLERVSVVALYVATAVAASMEEKFT